MTQYLKITDLAGVKPAVGYHDVDDDFELPLSTKYDKFEFVKESEARQMHPALFGVAVEETAKKSTKEVKEVKE